MSCALDNPDRDFSADPIDEEAKNLLNLLKRSEAAEIFDEIVRRRIGELIGQAVLNTTKQR
jgi:hypothetical protein